MIEFPFFRLWREAEQLERDMEVKRKVLRSQMRGIKADAAMLRRQAEELDGQAEELQIQIERHEVEECGAALLATWLLGFSRKLRMTPYVIAALERAREINDIWAVRSVALWYGVALPAECWGAVPSRRQVESQAVTAWSLPLCEGRLAA